MMRLNLVGLGDLPVGDVIWKGGLRLESWAGRLVMKEADGVAKSDGFSRLCSTVIAADNSAGIEGEYWDEIVVLLARPSFWSVWGLVFVRGGSLIASTEPRILKR